MTPEELFMECITAHVPVEWARGRIERKHESAVNVAILAERERAARVDPHLSGHRGCGDAGCLVERPTGGLRTNGGCRCSAHKMQRAYIAAIRR